MMRLIVLVLVAGCAQTKQTSLHDQITALTRVHRGRVAVFAHHLTTGAAIAIDADTIVKTASTIKLAVLVEAMHQVKNNKLALTERIPLAEQDKVAGSGILQFLRAGIELAFEDVLTLMIIASDNTATNLAIDRVGGVGNVNRRLASLGLANTYLYKKIYVPATEPMPPDQKQFGLGKTTAREMVRLIEHVQRCELGDAALCRKMLGMLRNQQARYLLARFIETADTTETPSAVAAKLGELDAARMEVAIIDAHSGPITIAVFTWNNADERYSPENEAALLIARIGEVIIRAWSPRGIRTGERD